MNRILYENRCKCNEEFSITKKRKLTNRSEGKPLQYLKSNEVISKTFLVQYQEKLSPTAKSVLNSFNNKYIYYAIDDILYGFKLNQNERDNLLGILYSPLISLQNNFAINFFDIWIREIYLEETTKTNKFISNQFQNLEQFTYIKIKLFYKTKAQVKKQEALW